MGCTNIASKYLPTWHNLKNETERSDEGEGHQIQRDDLVIPSFGFRRSRPTLAHPSQGIPMLVLTLLQRTILHGISTCLDDR